MSPEAGVAPSRRDLPGELASARSLHHPCLMRSLVVLMVVAGCGSGRSEPDAALDPECVRLEAIVASWPNGVGYCDGTLFVACNQGRATVTDCSPKQCFHYSVPRIVVVACPLDEPDARCIGSGLWLACDGTTRLICYNGLVIARRPDECH